MVYWPCIEYLSLEWPSVQSHNCFKSCSGSSHSSCSTAVSQQTAAFIHCKMWYMETLALFSIDKCNSHEVNYYSDLRLTQFQTLPTFGSRDCVAVYCCVFFFFFSRAAGIFCGCDHFESCLVHTTNCFVFTQEQDTTRPQCICMLISHSGGGISSYAGQRGLAGQSLKPCLDQAVKDIPKERHHLTPVYLGATAGMRLLQWVCFYGILVFCDIQSCITALHL